jgi:hypothetical protein
VVADRPEREQHIINSIAKTALTKELIILYYKVVLNHTVVKAVKQDVSGGSEGKKLIIVVLCSFLSSDEY